MNNKTYIKEYWNVSPFNFNNKINDFVPKSIEIFDTTLRDGISDPCRAISLAPYKKVEIAKILDGLGIPKIEIGLTNDADLPVLKKITKENLKTKTFAMTPTSSFTWKEWKAIDIALEAKIDGVVINFPASEYLVEKFLPGWSMNKMLDKAISMTSYAKENGLDIDFFAYDTTRANQNFLKKLYEAAAKIGVNCITIVDTLGVASPRGISYLVNVIKSWVDIPIGLHMHNDFNLAIANNLAGIEQGALTIHSTINGIGKMAPTEALITILNILYGIPFNIIYKDIFQSCKKIREIGGWNIDPYEPIIGDLAFAYDSDHRLEENKSQKAPFSPEFIGHDYKILLNNNTGPKCINYRLQKLGIEATDDQIERILGEMKTYLKKTREITDKNFATIVKKVICKK